MARTRKAVLTLSGAIQGYMLDAAARRLSPHTIADYQNSFRKLQAFIGDPPLAGITADDVRLFLADLASTPRAAGGCAPRPVKPPSEKQVLNIHTGLSALWTWAVTEGYAPKHILHEIRRPKPKRPAIVPLTQGDVKALLDVVERSIGFSRPGQRPSDYARPTGARDRAMILLLLDTGVRASELCGLQLRSLDLKNKAITVLGKGNKERHLPFGPLTGKALFQYVSAERREASANEKVFVTDDGRELTRDWLLKLLQRLGNRAGVVDVHPHRFRHTYAIEYLRNGGNTRSLQESLGHETLDMIRTYTAVAEADLANAHRTASPVEKWRL